MAEGENESSKQTEQCRKLRSLNNDISTYVRFKNRCDRIATLFWLNFKGDLVRYSVLKKDEFIDMNTYVTHPWCAREIVTNDRLVIDKQPVYQPTEGENGIYRLAYIDIPGIETVLGQGADPGCIVRGLKCSGEVIPFRSESKACFDL